MAEGPLFERWIAAFRDGGDAAVRALVAVPVLVEVAPPDVARCGPGFFTSVQPATPTSKKSTQVLLAGPVHGAFLVAKKEGGAFAEQIGVGRSRTADIVLPYRHISKLHAVFLRPGGGEDAFLLMDAGSTNGTWLDGTRLTPRKAVPVSSGAIVRLGSSRLVFLSPEALVGFVRDRAGPGR